MKEKNYLVMSLVLVLVVVSIGFTFAYFIGSGTVSGSGASTSISTADVMKVKYDAGTSKLEDSGLMPGKSVNKGFKVTVKPSTYDITYRIYLRISNNDFRVCNDSNYNSVTNDCSRYAEELIYILKDGNGVELARGDLTYGITGEIELVRQTKKVSTTTDFNYTIEIKYIDTLKDQNHNKNKNISGDIKVEYATPDTSDLDLVAVYVQKADNSAQYEYAPEVPTSGYSLNDHYTRCEVSGRRDNTLNVVYDGKISVSDLTNRDTKCYVYFDRT